MSNGRQLDRPAIYQIRVFGNLDAQWSDWFDGFAVSAQTNGETLMIGEVRDQSALYGLLAKIGSLGLPLLSIIRMGFGEQGNLTIDENRNEHWRENDEHDDYG